MLFPLLLTLQTAAAPATPPVDDPRYKQCLDRVTSDAKAGEAEAGKWLGEGGGFLARQCAGVAQANQQRWPEAAESLSQAARDAEKAKDGHASDFWAQAGNAWLAAGQPAKARSALDAALAPGLLVGLPLGEAYLDRARAWVAEGDNEGARADIDRALTYAKDDPLAWLLSATLARREGDLKRAKADIGEALTRSADDPSVQLEAGNIAAMNGDSGGAQAAWNRVIELSPGSALATSARHALQQFPPDEK